MRLNKRTVVKIKTKNNILVLENGLYGTVK